VSTGEQVALQPSLAEVLGEDLHDLAIRGEVVVARDDVGVPRSVGGVEQRTEAVGRGLVRAMTRNVRGLARTTSRRNSPATRVASLTPVAGSGTSTA
jgi:hypothetical protein